MAKKGEVCRSGENKPSRSPLLIDILFDCNEQFRATLHLIEDNRAFQQRFGIRLRCRQRGKIIQRTVGTVTRECRFMLERRALPGLPQSGKYDDRQLPQGFFQPRCDFACMI